MTQTTPSHSQAVELARRFHDAYERLAPQFGYITREDTRAFDPESSNGKLMTAVCAELTSQQEVAAPVGDAQDAARWRRLVNASEMEFPVATIADDPENDATMCYGRKYLESYIDRLDEIPNTYAASRDQSNLAVAESDPVQGVEPVARDREADRRRFPDADFNRWLDESVTENGEFSVWDLIPSVGSAWNGWNNRALYTAPPSSKTQDDLAGADNWTPEEIDAVICCLDDDAAAMLNENDEDERAHNMQRAATMIQVFSDLASQPKAPAPVPVVQGEATETMRRHVEDFARRHGWTPESGEGAFECVQRLCYAQGRKDATPANIVVGAGGDVWASVVTEDEVAMLLPWFESGVNTLQLRAALQEFADSRCPSTTPAPEQATTGSGQGVTDAVRLDFMANEPARYIEKSPSGMWRVYEDTAPANFTSYNWQALVMPYSATPREAIDAAIISTASPAGECGDGK